MPDLTMHEDRPVLFLGFRVAAERRVDLLRFLREAITTYEELPGIRARLLQSREDPGRWIELVEYPDRATYEADQRRVDEDPRMVRLLDRWHSIIEGPVDVEIWEEWTLRLKETHDE